jgi:primosomal protein N' (replication factor Y)
MVCFSGEDDVAVMQAACKFAEMVQQCTMQRGDIPLRILGPAPMNVAMVKHQYRYKLTIKCRNDASFRAMMRETLAAYGAAKLPGKASVYLDFYSNADL